MKRLPGLSSLTAVMFAAVMVCSATAAHGQTYVKLNGLYALAGVINPQVEFRISEHSAFQTEIVASPWKSVLGGHHMLFGILMNEYRYYVSPQKTRGFYVGGNVGIQVFDISRPDFTGGLHLQNRYCKGFGFMFGTCLGYEHTFAGRWIVDAFVGMSWMHSWYNGYTLDGQIEMNPRHLHPKPYPDPFNASAEWMPNKAGVSIGYLIFDPRNGKR